MTTADAFLFIQGDVFDTELELSRKAYSLVYADPPYAGCRAKYARGNNSRQWGRDARADFMRELIGRMEELRAATDGVCAVSMGTPELRLLHLFPSKCRVAAWVKKNVSPRPGIRPSFAWEPLVMWGDLPTTGGAVNDWAELSPRVTNRRGHESPKPDAFAEWVLDLTMGDRGGSVMELFAGTAPIARLAASRGLQAHAVDLADYREMPSTYSQDLPPDKFDFVRTPGGPSVAAKAQKQRRERERLDAMRTELPSQPSVKASLR